MRLIFKQVSFPCIFSPEEDPALFSGAAVFLGSVLFNDVAQNTSPMKLGARAGIAKGCCVGAGLWRRQSSL